MRRYPFLIALIQGALVFGFVVLLRSGAMPLGIPGEWTWSRLPDGVAWTALDRLNGLVGLSAYAGFVAIGWRSLSSRSGRWRESAWLGGLALMAVFAQLVVQIAAPDGYGLTKWTFALHSSGSSGYYTVARSKMNDPWRFWAEYPEWIKDQDALHIGTHPPGLFLWSRSMLGLTRSNPALAHGIVGFLPGSIRAGFREIRRYDPLPVADQAALTLTGALTLIACALTVVPLYGLARLALPAPSAWATASLWPLVPSAILFQPTADTLFPLLATTALALAMCDRWLTSAASGVVLALGMLLSLAFLAVGLVVAIVLAASPKPEVRRRVLMIGVVGLGFLAAMLGSWAISGANPFVIWWWNQKNHARFYVEYPRSYLAWNLANPIELAVGLGLPIAVWSLIGLRRAPRVVWATLFVICLLQLSGRNLSEVARLWLPLMPPLLVSAGGGMSLVGGRAATLATTIVLLGTQTLLLQATIQVVYAV